MNAASERAVSLHGRDLLSVADLTAAEVIRVYATTEALKREFLATRRHPAPPLVGRTVALLFQKPSLRTRVTFEAGMTQLGGLAIYLPEDAVMGAREAVRDLARNLERFVDGIVARTGPHAVVTELAAQAGIPVINGLTLREHPCQALADIFTIRERLGELRGTVVAFVGDGNNVYHSLALLGAAFGMEIRLAHPQGYGPNEAIVAQARELAGASGGRVVFGHDPFEAVRGAAVVYTDAWTSMGQEAETEERRDAFAGYRVDDALLDAAGPDVVAMHCQPAHRGEEITSAVMDGPRSLIWEQSENRLHVQKGLLVELLGGYEPGMTENLYEGYKEALRRGHVAALRGRLEVAVDAYREASRLAPDRVLPYVTLGGVLDRLGRPDEALAAYAAALAITPNDEGALHGRADVEAETGRRAEAATTLDQLAAILDGQGRLADACNVARRALELAESRSRRKGVAALVARLRQTSGDPSAAEALARALTVLEVDPMAARRPEAESGAEDVADASGDASAAAQAASGPPDPSSLSLAFEAALDAGDVEEARRQAVLAAAGHRSLGQVHAGIDDCYEALAIAPADPDIHLALAELYLDRGWRALSADKLVLLGRLVQLTGDNATRARLCYLAATRFPDDARLATICA